MNRNHQILRTLMVSSLMLSLLALSACRDKDGSAMAQEVSDPAPSASANAAYAPPTADQLYQLVAPIALFPDQLVALVLAGSTYPDQVAAANTWVRQNPNLSGTELTSAVDQQAWDPSVKALTAFPAVLSQMANNEAWMSSLGQAYYNDPSDVMNAIQVMRQRAQAAGNLGSNRQVKVVQEAPSEAYVPESDAPVVYDGPPIVPPPSQMLVIEPAQPDVVYVPMYDPALVYGAPMAMYPDYVYRSPPMMPGVAVVGPVSFGTGIIIGATFGTVAWGWHAWGMHWGGPHGHDDHGRPGGWQRPAVVYNHTTYVSRSPVVVNHRFNENRFNNNRINGNTRTPVNPGVNRDLPNSRPMTVPHFTPNDARPRARPAARPYGQPAESGHPAGAQPLPHEQRQHEQMQRQELQRRQIERQQTERQQTQHPRPESRPQFNREAPTVQHPPAQQHFMEPHPQAHPQPRPQPQQHMQQRPQSMERPQPQPHMQQQAPQPQAAPAAPHAEGGHGDGRH